MMASAPPAQGEGLAHTGTGGKQADAPGVLEVVRTVHHLLQIVGEGAGLFLRLLLIEGVEGEAIVAQGGHLCSPPPSLA